MNHLRLQNYKNENTDQYTKKYSKDHEQILR